MASDKIDCSVDKLYLGELFSLSIRTSFRGTYHFKFCVGDKVSYLISEYDDPGYNNRFEPRIRPAMIHKSKVKLTQELTSELKDKYVIALNFNPKDNSHGQDGETWCFMPKNGLSQSKHCFWSPDASEKRGLKGIYELGNFVYELSGLKSVR